MIDKITLITEDNIQIIGDYYPTENKAASAVVLLHMMPATKESWSEFAQLLATRGFQVLAIDERGHGESTQNGELDYREFGAEEQQAKMLDLISAVNFFKEKGLSARDIFVGGASIGANLSLQYLADNEDARAAFALSPGYDYYGIETKPLIERMHRDQIVYMAAAKDDPNVPDSAAAVEELCGMGSVQKTCKIFEQGGHGTDMFQENHDLMRERNPELMRGLADWLERALAGE
ncbi:MAG: alpha/beta fold hydrolase [Candidatus Spechtbacterales bacterium]